MSTSLLQPQRSLPVKTLDDVRPQMVKAVNRSQADQPRWTQVLEQVLVRHYGSLKAAAISLGDYDQGQMRRDLDKGTFRFERLEHCDADARAVIAAGLADAFVVLSDPAARARQVLREAKRKIEEAEQALEYLAS